MKNVLKSNKHLLVAALLGITVIIAASWQTADKKPKDNTTDNAARDTTQPKQRNDDKDEFRMNELEDAMKQLDIQIQKLDLQMKDIDLKISKQLKEALANVDAEKINSEVQEHLKNVDLDKIKLDVDRSLEEAKQQMKNIDMDKLKIQMQELQKHINSDELKKHIEDAMKGAKENIEKAKKEMQELKDFTDQLEKDGLIDKEKGYSIEWKNGGELYINGKKQPKEISEKYKKYYKKDGWRIEMNGHGDKSREFM
jgi:TolA-binding protein